MAILVSENSDVITITLGDKFVFSDHQEFHKSYNARPPGLTYMLDFRRVSYMDSAALGMLLVFHEHNGKDKARIKLLNCNEQVRKIFAVANFANLFTIE